MRASRISVPPAENPHCSASGPSLVADAFEVYSQAASQVTFAKGDAMSQAPLDLAKSMQAELTDIRRDFHQHPEIAWEEVRTGTKAADYCEKLGLKVKRGAAKTGVVAELNSGKPGKVLALRADM